MRIITSVALVACMMTAFTSCLEDKCTNVRTYIQYNPVFVPESEIRPGIAVEAPRTLKNPGNIYVYKNYLLINERWEGVHIIENSDPANPVHLSFISIPGNLNMAVRNDVLYADLYLDLVAIDISDLANTAIIGREDGIFAHYYPLTEGQYIVRYEPTERTEELDCGDEQWGRPWFSRQDALFIDVALADNAAAPAVGTGGSMARFTIASDHLYALDDYRIRVFSIGAGLPDHINTVEVDWGIETLFPYGDYLFVGANAGMYIMDNSEPTDPQLISKFVHAMSCDPVFVTGDVAFVTLRDGNACQGFTNALEVVDVSDMHDPRLIRSYPMENPHGLSVVDETLFLCEGRFGLKVFGTRNLNRIDENLLTRVGGLHGYDVIALENGDHLIVVGEDGVYQYDASDRSRLRELSNITISRL